VLKEVSKLREESKSDIDAEPDTEELLQRDFEIVPYTLSTCYN